MSWPRDSGNGRQLEFHLQCLLDAVRKDSQLVLRDTPGEEL